MSFNIYVYIRTLMIAFFLNWDFLFELYKQHLIVFQVVLKAFPNSEHIDKFEKIFLIMHIYILIVDIAYLIRIVNSE